MTKNTTGNYRYTRIKKNGEDPMTIMVFGIPEDGKIQTIWINGKKVKVLCERVSNGTN